MKPDPALYRILLDRYQLKAEESLFIDDNAANIATARELGFQAVHLTPDLDLEGYLKEQGILEAFIGRNGNSAAAGDPRLQGSSALAPSPHREGDAVATSPRTKMAFGKSGCSQ